MPENMSIKQMAAGLLVLTSFFLLEGNVRAREETVPDVDNVLVYPSIAVVVNKAVVIRLPKKVARVVVTQPKIAEVVVVAPDQLLIHGRAVGATSLVVWFEEATARKE
jgi:Flp pilus assembly secretin CpaC